MRKEEEVRLITLGLMSAIIFAVEEHVKERALAEEGLLETLQGAVTDAEQLLEIIEHRLN